MAGLFSRIRNALRGKSAEPDKTEKNDFTLPWIEASDNPYGKRLLDLRPLTLSVLSTTKDRQIAENALSYNGEDGTSFSGQTPENTDIIEGLLSYAVDGRLEPGVLFIPRAMEHKWAIFFHEDTIIFVRSWLRQVQVRARTAQKDDRLTIIDITGAFTDDASAEFTRSSLHYLLLSHVLDRTTPAPLPPVLAGSLREAGLWAFSMYGNMAQVGIFEESFRPSADVPLRSHSLLHIAVAQADAAAIERQIENGVPLGCLAADGLSPLHWSLAHDDVAIMEKLLKLGADPNIVSVEGATPIMNAAQSNRLEHLKMLVKAGGKVNAMDERGFTALHRAAEIGHEAIVAYLLGNGADKTAMAQGYTPGALAELRHHENIVAMLS